MMKKIFNINSKCHMRYLLLDDFCIELFDFLDRKLSQYRAQTSGYNHWALVVKNKKIFCDNLEKKKIKIIRIPKPHGITYFIEDPECNLIEVKEF